jgi:selenide,water dikinase
VLGDLPVSADERVLIDYRTADDAGVYRIDANRALVQTVDFFTPIVDDPFTYGQIAAANSLSDVYAMGGRPLTALAIAAFPADLEPLAVKAIFAGGLQKLNEAGVALLGGHTVQDREIKFGYSVTGEIDPAAIWANTGARPGDVLLLTKAIGTGVISTAVKFARAPAEAVDAAVQSMVTLNHTAARILREVASASVHACTDITGFGLIGHASEMAAGSRCTVEIDVSSVPLLPGVRGLLKANVPGGGRTNAKHFGGEVRLARELDPDLVQLLHDPQTSGGLLAAVAPDRAGPAQSALSDAGVPVARIGRVAAEAGCRVILT